LYRKINGKSLKPFVQYPYLIGMRNNNHSNDKNSFIAMEKGDRNYADAY